MAQKITIYTTPACGYCQLLKQFFNEHNITYQEIDVAADLEKAKEMMEKSGQMAVPVTLITDEKGKEELVVGFDQKRLSELLGI